MKRTNSKTFQLTALALMSALVAVVQTISAFAGKFGIFSITLTLVPVVVGGILLGRRAGAILGFVFGLMVCIFSVTGVDAGGQLVFAESPVLGWLLCLVKGVAAGFLPALLYHVMPNKTHPNLSAFCASILAPIANTGIFIAGMLLFFRPLLDGWKNASGFGADTMIGYLILGLCGVNFLIEFAVAVILSPAIAAIVRAVKAGKRETN